MGAVFKARHLRLGRQVAVKFLPADLASRPEFRIRFEREAHALALLNHPNIVTIHDYGEEDGQGYIVMELVEGQSLASALPLPPERAIDVVLKIAEALSYAHSQGIIHRDIKPGNVLIDTAGNVKVTDFGLARMAGGDARGWTLTTPDQTLGTLYYMAPEVMTGAAPDPRMDVYSLGVLLYQTMTGSLPIGEFEHLPGPVDHVVRRALSQLPDRRYATIDEFASELRGARSQVAKPGNLLPPAEQQWLRAVALVYATATALAGWALLTSMTPIAVNPGELHPLSMVSPRKLADGRLVSLARFEVWPTLGALAAFGIALTASGLWRRHLSQAGLDKPDPERPLGESNWMVVVGLIAMALYGLRRVTEHWHPTVAMYSPFFGAIIELASMYVFWTAMLEAKRRARPLKAEPKLFFGFALVLVPPALELTTYALPWLG
jgi:serine/threonine-protein kinase